MLISSRFRDYYDSASAHGVDKTVVYGRLQNNFEGSKIDNGDFSRTSGKGYDQHLKCYVDTFWIGFCGKWYFGRHESKGYGLNEQISIYYGEEAIERTYGAAKKNRGFWKLFQDPRPHVARLNGSENLDLFLKHDTPIIFVCEWQMIVNPKLSDWGFQKVFDPFAAFQQIEMFLTNQLVKQVDPPQLSDKDRIKAHGMDHTSFRGSNQPAKRKRK